MKFKGPFILLLFLPLCHCQFGSCSYFQPMTVGTTYNVFSPGYPSLYKAGTNCEWQAQAPAGYKININCGTVQLSQDIYGNLDRIEISYTGDPTLSNAQVYTTNQSFAYSTSGNKVAMALRSSTYSSGGKFLCTLAASGGAIVSSTIAPSISNPVFCNCGRQNINYQYVNGVQTPTYQFPSAAGLMKLPYGSVFCGATIIARTYAITAAHCVINQNAQSIGLLVGNHNYQTGTSTAYSSILPISQIITNTAYTASTYNNDIALVQTASSITYNIDVGQACLPFSFAQQSNALGNYFVEGVGWQTSSLYNFYSYSITQKAPMTIIPNQQCQQYLPVVATQLCQYTPYNNTCQINTGGPVYYNQNGFTYLVGVTSFGQGCGSKVYPGVSARITSYLNWIIQNSPGASYCYK